LPSPHDEERLGSDLTPDEFFPATPRSCPPVPADADLGAGGSAKASRRVPAGTRNASEGGTAAMACPKLAPRRG